MESYRTDLCVLKTSTHFLAAMTSGGKPYTTMFGGIGVGERGAFQGAVRYMLGENEEHSSKYVAAAVASLQLFMAKLLEYIRWNAPTDEMREVVTELFEHIKACRDGMAHLQETYPENTSLPSAAAALDSSISLFDKGYARYGTATQQPSELSELSKTHQA
jgi:hypothetical protein